MSFWSSLSLKTRILSLTLGAILFVSVTASVVMFFSMKGDLIKQESHNQEAKIAVLEHLLRQHDTTGKGFHLKDGELFVGDFSLRGNEKDVDYIKEFFDGTATIFEKDVRIATNVMKNGKRLTGSKLSPGKAFESVFKHKKTYHGINTIAGTSYLTSYQPIISNDGEVIGILYAGIKEAEFLNVIVDVFLHAALGSILAVILVVVGVSFVLTRTLNPVRAIETGILDAVKKVNGISEQLVGVSDNAKKAAGYTSESATTVASGSEETSVQVESVASATEELSSSIHEISNHLKALTEQHVAHATDSSNKAEAKTQSLVQAAEKIGQVIDLIVSIADQTNLLALNASIEAARAGDAGRGFAVVADEVKKLATQTADATQDISALIKDIQTGTSEAAEAMGGVQTSLREVDNVALSISNAVNEQGTATQDISNSLQQAALGTTQISKSVGAIMDAAQNTEGESDRVQQLVQELMNQGEELQACWNLLHKLANGES